MPRLTSAITATNTPQLYELFGFWTALYFFLVFFLVFALYELQFVGENLEVRLVPPNFIFIPCYQPL